MARESKEKKRGIHPVIRTSSQLGFVAGGCSGALNAAASLLSLHGHAKPSIRARQDTTVERGKGFVSGKPPGAPNKSANRC